MIVVRRTYVPRPGTGGQLLALIHQVSDGMVDAGYSPSRIFRTHTGYHGTLVVDQEWESFETYEASRRAVRETQAITSVFDEIYPLLQTTHHTEILVEA